MYSNIEKRQHAKTLKPEATYRGWDASGRFWYVGRGGRRGNLWWAEVRDTVEPTIFGETLRDISHALAVTHKKAEK